MSVAAITADACSLTSRGYGIPKAILSDAEHRALCKELTMTPNRGAMMLGGTGPPPSFPIYQESATKLYVPKHFGLQRWGYPGRCELDSTPTRVELPEQRMRFDGQMRPEQQAPAAAFLKAARDPVRMGGILSLPCGYGKTILALYLVGQLGVRTVVIVHKDFLMNQWRERIQQFLPNARIGIIKADVMDAGPDRDIVLASVQSVSMKSYAKDAFGGFGFMIIDECHRVGTEVFSRALRKINCRFSLGLSATVTRKDGMTRAFTHFLGDVLYKVSRNAEVVRVAQQDFYDADPRYSREEVIGALGKPNTSRMINNIAAFLPRTAFIVASVLSVVRHDQQRKVLVLSDRKSQLSQLHAGLVAAGIEAGFYWGGMKPADLAISETRQVMLATFAYASEGMDVPGLDTLVLASPKSDIEQSCGRILRTKAEARSRVPLIIDVVDRFSMFVRQGGKRLAFYKKHGYTVFSSLEAAIAGPASGTEAAEPVLLDTDRT